MALTPDNLTRQYFIDKGYHVSKVEGWRIQPNIRRADFLGIYDYLAFNEEEEIAIQTTTKANISTRRKKMLTAKTFEWWTSGKTRRSLLHGWYKESGMWCVKEEELTMEDWHKRQKEIRQEEQFVDVNSPLYKELMGDGKETT